MNRINNNFIKHWCENIKTYCALVFAILTTILSFVSLDEMVKLSICLKVVILVGIVLIVAFASFIVTRRKSHRVIWQRNNCSINVKYDDLFKIKTKGDNRNLVVIPVNTYFDTIVDLPNTVAHPIVSPTTLHGIWIKKILADEHNTQQDLQRTIFHNLDYVHEHYANIQRDRGSNRKYTTGTCCMYTIGNTDYVLLALTTFDDNNTAHCTRDNLIESVKSLLVYIDQHGQGYDCFVPIMGTGRSRTGLTHEEALKVITNTMLLYSDQINCNINIVIYKGDSDKVSIYDA